MKWDIFFTALGLAIAFEGAFYFLMAPRLPELLKILAQRPVQELRLAGFVGMVLGLCLLWFFVKNT